MVPNFLIAGAPRCGTTALFEYLRSHPAVYFSEPKEPHFFATDLARHRAVGSLDAYLKLFSKARQQHRAVGEGSVFYLYSRDALPNIRAVNPDVKIIVMLRNPVDLCHSLHAHFQLSFYESEPNFESAWRLMSARSSGEHCPSTCPEPALLQYQKIASLGEQMERLFSLFPRDQVLTIVFDDFCRSPRDTYARVLRFLDVELDGRSEFPVVNQSRGQRVRWVGRFSRPAGKVSRSLGIVRRRLGLSPIGLLNRVYRSNMEPTARTPLTDAFRRELNRAFRDDVKRLSHVMGRDFSHWVT